jgi:hypothetical protein
VTGSIRPDGVVLTDTRIDLTRSRLTLPMLNWTKPAGTPGTVRATAVIGNDNRAVVDSFSIDAGDLAVRGSANVAFNGRADVTAAITNFKLQRSHLRNLTVQTRGDRLALRVGDGVLDMSGVFATAAPAPSDGSITDPPGPAARTPGAAFDELPFAALEINAPALQRVYFGEERYLENVLVRLSRAGGRWRSAQISAAVPKTAGPHRALLLDYGPADGGGMSLRVHAADLGATLKAVNLSDGVRRGQLDMAGRSRRDDPDGPIAGQFTVTDFVVKDVPVLAQILSVDSLVNFRRLFEGEGITFTDMTGDVSIADDTITLQQSRAVGGSLAITTNGTYDLARDKVAFEGHVVPARRINELVAKIPVLGSVLTGANKEGIVAVRFVVTGEAGNPKVAVSPGSVLTPGILRDIFGGILN